MKNLNVSQKELLHKKIGAIILLTLYILTYLA
jgi:hypothetical protein